jgi:hypothetical protein
VAGNLSPGGAELLGVTSCDSEEGRVPASDELRGPGECQQAAANSESWYAVHTLARHEKKVSTQLQERAITSFLPLISEEHQ